MEISVLTIDHEITIGMKIRLHRIARGWRQSDLAAHAHVTPGAVSAVERNMPCHDEAMRRICETLGIEE